MTSLDLKRRTLLGGAGAAAAAVAFDAAAARRTNAPLKVLTPPEQATLEALGEALLPGAAEAGIAHFVDAQLTKPPADALLILRYFDWPPPYFPFYRGGLAAAEGAAQAARGKPLARFTPEEADAFAGSLFTGQVEGWKGPPAPLFYLATRSDAVDVVYGTEKGFEALGVPYMPHIAPTRPW